jgi:hypothetical protein
MKTHIFGVVTTENNDDDDVNLRAVTFPLLPFSARSENVSRMLKKRLSQKIEKGIFSYTRATGTAERF